MDDGDGCPDEGGRARWRMRGDRDAADMTLTGAIRFGNDAIVPGSVGTVDQLARHMIALGAGLRVAIASDTAARREALEAALTERGVPADAFEVVTDAELRGNRVVVTRAPSAEESAQQSTDEAESEEGDGEAAEDGAAAEADE